MWIKFKKDSVRLETPVGCFPSHSPPCRGEHCCEFDVFYSDILLHVNGTISKIYYCCVYFLMSVLYCTFHLLFVLFINVGMQSSILLTFTLLFVSAHNSVAKYLDCYQFFPQLQIFFWSTFCVRGMGFLVYILSTGTY